METIDSIKNQVLRHVRDAVREMPQAQRDELDKKYAQLKELYCPRPVVDGNLLERFIEKHEAVHGTATVVGSHSDVPSAVCAFFAEHDLTPKVLMNSSEFISSINWPDGWLIEHRRAEKSDAISITAVLCAIAETGTFLVGSSPQSPSSHLFVPENHIVVLDSSQIVGHLEDALELLGESVMLQSRGIHMITGPSKTADVEQTIQYGAHGPKRLHAVIIDSGS